MITAGGGAAKRNGRGSPRGSFDREAPDPQSRLLEYDDAAVDKIRSDLAKVRQQQIHLFFGASLSCAAK